ncbi:MAG: hypothetical protein U0795_25830 [Pirellulales bacterium]
MWEDDRSLAPGHGYGPTWSFSVRDNITSLVHGTVRVPFQVLHTPRLLDFTSCRTTGSSEAVEGASAVRQELNAALPLKPAATA